MMCRRTRVRLFEFLYSFVITNPAAPTAASIQLALTEEEAESGATTGAIAWLAEGIKLRTAQ